MCARLPPSAVPLTNIQWNITLERNAHYRLENKGAANKVYSGDQAQVNAEVIARPQDQEWVIEETNTGTYTSCSTVGALVLADRIDRISTTY